VKKAKVKFEPIMGMLEVNGMMVDVELFAMLFKAPARVLWRFEVVEDRVVATPYDEREVIFLNKEAP
jgi:hypothetical protein